MAVLELKRAFIKNSGEIVDSGKVVLLDTNEISEIVEAEHYWGATTVPGGESSKYFAAYVNTVHMRNGNSWHLSEPIATIRDKWKEALLEERTPQMVRKPSHKLASTSL